MEDFDEIFKEGIEEGKKSPPKNKRKKQEQEPGVARITFNPGEEYPLYTVRIPRELAKECKIEQGDKMYFFIDVKPDGKKQLKAELRRK